MFNRPLHHVAFAAPLSVTASRRTFPRFPLSLRPAAAAAAAATTSISASASSGKNRPNHNRARHSSSSSTSTASTSSSPPSSSPRRRVRHRQKQRAHARQVANDKWERVQPFSVAAQTTTSNTLEQSLPISFSTSSVPTGSDLRPENCPALVLNADFSPLSYMPLSLWPWQEVVKAVFLDRVTVVATYDVGVRSPGMLFPLPSVISLKEYQPTHVKTPAFTRFNVFLRDGFACQYCGGRFGTHDLTFDHVMPRCVGGKTNWGNVVTACVKCNHSKGRSLLKDLRGMKLKRTPKEPTNQQLQASARKFPPRYLHDSWRDYVYWSQSMRVEKDDDDVQGEEARGNAQ